MLRVIMQKKINGLHKIENHTCLTSGCKWNLPPSCFHGNSDIRAGGWLVSVNEPAADGAPVLRTWQLHVRRVNTSCFVLIRQGHRGHARNRLKVVLTAWWCHLLNSGSLTLKDDTDFNGTFSHQLTRLHLYWEHVLLQESGVIHNLKINMIASFVLD